jgi:hypothetical protein
MIFCAYRLFTSLVLVGSMFVASINTANAQETSAGFATSPFSGSAANSEGGSEVVSDVKSGVMLTLPDEDTDGTDLPVDGGVLLLFTIAIGIAYKYSKRSALATN